MYAHDCLFIMIAMTHFSSRDCSFAAAALAYFAVKPSIVYLHLHLPHALLAHIPHFFRELFPIEFYQGARPPNLRSRNTHQQQIPRYLNTKKESQVAVFTWTWSARSFYATILHHALCSKPLLSDFRRLGIFMLSLILHL
jgi:hypothetical protein